MPQASIPVTHSPWPDSGRTVAPRPLNTLASPVRRGERTKTPQRTFLPCSDTSIMCTMLPPARRGRIGAGSEVRYQTLLRPGVDPQQRDGPRTEAAGAADVPIVAARSTVVTFSTVPIPITTWLHIRQQQSKTSSAEHPTVMRHQPASCEPPRPAVWCWSDSRQTVLSDHAAVEVEDQLGCLPAA